MTKLKEKYMPTTSANKEEDLADQVANSKLTLSS